MFEAKQMSIFQRLPEQEPTVWCKRLTVAASQSAAVSQMLLSTAIKESGSGP